MSDTTFVPVYSREEETIPRPDSPLQPGCIPWKMVAHHRLELTTKQAYVSWVLYQIGSSIEAMEDFWAVVDQLRQNPGTIKYYASPTGICEPRILRDTFVTDEGMRKMRSWLRICNELCEGTPRYELYFKTWKDL